ncbi:hypothetical protein [Thalassotalea agariperforans]
MTNIELKLNDFDLTKYVTDLKNWRPLKELPEKYEQFDYSQLKYLMWKREEHQGLSQCVRIVGKRMYVCVPLFGLWLSNSLPEQIVSSSVTKGGE